MVVYVCQYLPKSGHVQFLSPLLVYLSAQNSDRFMPLKRHIIRDLWNEEYELVQKLPPPPQTTPEPEKAQFSKRLYFTAAAIYPNRIVQYSVPEDGYHPTDRQKANTIHLEDNRHEGEISKKAARKIEKAITWMLFKSKRKKVYDRELDKTFYFNINFITLTLPCTQIHPDKEITNRCLGNWLEVAKKQFGLTNYVWKAEKQQGGNIHYHIVSDCYIHYTELRRTWNKSIELLGYITGFEFKHRHRNAPTEQVKSIKDIQKVANYIGSYMSKNVKYGCIGKLIRENEIFEKQLIALPVLNPLTQKYDLTEMKSCNVLMSYSVREVLYGSEEYRKVKNMKSLGKVVGSILGAYCEPVTGRLWGCSHSLSRCKPVTLNEIEYCFEDLHSFIQLAQLKTIQLEHAMLFCGKVATTAKVIRPDIYAQLELASQGLPVPVPVVF